MKTSPSPQVPGQGAHWPFWTLGSLDDDYLNDRKPDPEDHTMGKIADWLLQNVWYKKPQWRDITDYTRELNDESLIQRYRPQSPSPPARTVIPSRLSLDRVLANKTCSPMSLHDFYLYLKYCEHSSENLEFYLWFKNYNVNYPDAKRDKIPEEAPRPPPKTHSVSVSDADVSSVTELFRNKESLKSIEDDLAQLETPCVKAAKSPSMFSGMLSFITFSSRDQKTCSDGECRLNDFDDNLDLEAQGSTVPLPLFAKLTNGGKQENRAELDAALATFLQPGAEKELNISHIVRRRVLEALEKSSDPRHLQPVADHIYEVMKNCSHRNFVSVGLVTGTYETVCVGFIIGVLNIIAGFLLVCVQAFHPYIGAHSRVSVFYALPLWAMGVTLLLVGTQGMCFIMLSMAKRQALPWERFDDEVSVAAPTTAAPPGPKGWWQKYRLFMNKTVAHDRQFKVEEKHLRRVQRMILVQCIGGGIIAGCLGVVLFVFLPIWKETR